MAKYKILVIGLLVASNVVKKFGDIVDENELIGKPNDLVKDGFVELVEVDEAAELKAKQDQEAADLKAKEDQEKAEELEHSSTMA